MALGLDAATRLAADGIRRISRLPGTMLKTERMALGGRKPRVLSRALDPLARRKPDPSGPGPGAPIATSAAFASSAPTVDRSSTQTSMRRRISSPSASAQPEDFRGWPVNRAGLPAGSRKKTPAWVEVRPFRAGRSHPDPQLAQRDPPEARLRRIASPSTFHRKFGTHHLRCDVVRCLAGSRYRVHRQIGLGGTNHQSSSSPVASVSLS